MAELAPSEKDAISHRGRAARALLAWLAEAPERRDRAPARKEAAPRGRRTRGVRAGAAPRRSLAGGGLLVASSSSRASPRLARLRRRGRASGTDLVAALLTLLALRVAVRPPDRDHPYGHGKAEHLAALAEGAVPAPGRELPDRRAVDRPPDRRRAAMTSTPAWWAFAVLAVVLVGRHRPRRRLAPRRARAAQPGAGRQRACISRPTSPARSPCSTGLLLAAPATPEGDPVAGAGRRACSSSYAAQRLMRAERQRPDGPRARGGAAAPSARRSPRREPAPSCAGCAYARGRRAHVRRRRRRRSRPTRRSRRGTP